MKFLRRLVSVAGKPINVVAFRIRQEIVLHWMRLCGSWRRLERAANAKSNEIDIETLLQDIASQIPWRPPSPGQAEELHYRPFNGRSLAQATDRIINGHITIFGTDRTIPCGSDWHRDPIHDRFWHPAYFRRYDFYEPRSRPFDVKRAWEPARLGFLLPVALSCVLSQDEEQQRRCLNRITGVLDDWSANNPVAYSIHWYPMEASVRLINLALLMAALAFAPPAAARDVAARKIFSMLVTHMDFVSRNLEYTDVRGNHYAANLVGLAAGAAVLECKLPQMKHIRHFAIREMKREILLQFLPDGVNIEKSLPYHQFVLELFLVGAATAKWSGAALRRSCLDRLESAAALLDRAKRPDGLIPAVGDNDSARLLTVELEPSRAPDGLLTLWAAFSGGRLSCPSHETFARAFIEIASRVNKDEADEMREPITVFPEGGLAAMSAQDSHLLVDFGEIGLHGRGGHSHNDLMSFELSLCGRALIVDRGSPTYTGDLELRDEYRSSRSHNTVCLDDAEHARFLGPWSMENRASARLAHQSADASGCEIVLDNQTFLDESPPVAHRRTLKLARDGKSFQCIDEVDPGGVRRQFVRYFHFSPECRPGSNESKSEITLCRGRERFRVKIGQSGDWSWIRHDVSEGYDEISEAYALRLVTESSKAVTLTLETSLVEMP